VPVVVPPPSVSVQASPQTPPKSDNQICLDSYGVNSSYTGQRGTNGGPICGCNTGYQWNSGQTSCIAVPAKTGYQSVANNMEMPHGMAHRTQVMEDSIAPVIKGTYQWQIVLVDHLANYLARHIKLRTAIVTTLTRMIPMVKPLQASCRSRHSISTSLCS